MPWHPGESGNPQGREPGTGKVQRLYAHIAADDLAAIVTAIVTAAKNGDMAAARLVADRIWPALRPVDPPALVALPADATIPEQARAIVAAALDGRLPANQAATLLTALASVDRLADGVTKALLESAWKALAQASSFDEIKVLRDKASAAQTLWRKLGMSREAQNEAAKIHLAASLRMGDWLRNSTEKATGGQPYQATPCKKQGVEKQQTYDDLGINYTDAFRLQRLYDWERETQGASKAVQALEEKGDELNVSKLKNKAVSHFKVEKRIYDIKQQAADIAVSPPLLFQIAVAYPASLVRKFKIIVINHE